MKENRISNGICQVSQFKNADIYKAHCDCLSNDHQQTLFVEYDEDTNNVTMSIFSQIYYNIRYEQRYNKQTQRVRHWFLRQLNKLKACWEILRYGQIEAENEFIFRNADQIRDYCTALTNSIDRLNREPEL